MGLIQKTDVRPIYPHCQTPPNDIYCQEIPGVLGPRYLYFCPQCGKYRIPGEEQPAWRPL